MLRPLCVLALLSSFSIASADPGKCLGQTKLSSLGGGIPAIPDYSLYGVSVCRIGDVDKDGIDDIAVGAYVEADGGPERGALYIHFMKANGTVKATQKISSTQGGFTATIEDGDGFGNSVAAIGDFDGDGVPDLAVGSWLDDDGGCCLGADRGAIYILRLNTNGTVKAWNKISSTHGGFPAILIDDGDRFAQALCSMGDIDHDGVVDLAVGALYDCDLPGSDNGGVNTGAVYTLCLTPQGNVKSWSKISNYYGNLTHVLANQDRFGFSVANLGDLDGDGTNDMAVGAIFDKDGGLARGAVYVLFMLPNGTVKAESKLSSLEGGAVTPNLLSNYLQNWDLIGHAVENMGDLDGDGVIELAVSAIGDDDGGGDEDFSDKGAIYLFSMTKAGKIARVRKISQTEGDFTGILDDGSRFGESFANLGDFNHDGIVDLAVGSIGDSNAGPLQGALWILQISDKPWTWLGAPLAGATGEPQWFGEGSLVPLSPASLTLSHARPNAQAFLLFSPIQINVPLLGGTLIPGYGFGPALALSVTTSPTGTFEWNLPWPPGLPAGLTLYSQVWILDDTGPAGVTASNGISFTQP